MERMLRPDEERVTIRLAERDDDPVVAKLAERAGAVPLEGRVLLAEVGGAPVAAISLESAATVARPTRRGEDAISLLLLRRYQLVSRSDDAPSPGAAFGGLAAANA
jgi:hypothetical protein